MFSSPLPRLTGTAVCPCQRGHRGHGGSHSEDVPEHQWPQTWGEQQSVSALPVCPLSLNRCTQLQRDTHTRLGCLSLVFFFTSLSSLCHLCSSSSESSRFHASHSSCVLLCFIQPPLLPPLPILQFNLWFLLQLHKVAVSRASDLLKVHGEQLPLRALKAAGAEGNLEAVAEYSRTLAEQKEQLVEVGRGQGGWETF